jgi:hypothetical protein
MSRTLVFRSAAPNQEMFAIITGVLKDAGYRIDEAVPDGGRLKATKRYHALSLPNERILLSFEFLPLLAGQAGEYAIRSTASNLTGVQLDPLGFLSRANVALAKKLFLAVESRFPNGMAFEESGPDVPIHRVPVAAEVPTSREIAHSLGQRSAAYPAGIPSSICRMNALSLESKSTEDSGQSKKSTPLEVPTDHAPARTKRRWLWVVGGATAALGIGFWTATAPFLSSCQKFIRENLKDRDSYKLEHVVKHQGMRGYGLTSFASGTALREPTHGFLGSLRSQSTGYVRVGLSRLRCRGRSRECGTFCM